MLDFVIDAALEAGADDAVVVVGYGREQVEAHLTERYGDRVRTALQDEQHGTGHAVQCALGELGEAQSTLILYGDGALLKSKDLAALLKTRADGSHALAMVTCELEDPTGYGRILREDGEIVGIREHRDCDALQLNIHEINTGVYAATTAFLKEALPHLEPNNDQGELYLTDIVAMAAAGGTVGHVAGDDPVSLGGVNDRAQLAEAETILFERIADRHRRAGVTIRSSARIEATVELDVDAVIEHGVVLRGNTKIGSGAHVDVGSVLDDVEVDAGARLLPYSVCSSSRIGAETQIGPFSHLRPGSRVDARAKVGNFVEMKKVRLHEGAKANHLSYLGDGEVHEGANIGAGTIFCNYDGFQKHRTVIGRGAFIGSDSQLVAPVRVGDGAYVATGTTVTQDVPDDGLAIARVRQVNKEGYAPRLRGRLKAAADEAKKKTSS
jgi:bifunctional UDP-N-acetylglucosamine pyrophosphorylase/glucosamine-1-phosphate N-acetyltransferase